MKDYYIYLTLLKRNSLKQMPATSDSVDKFSKKIDDDGYKIQDISIVDDQVKFYLGSTNKFDAPIVPDKLYSLYYSDEMVYNEKENIMYYTHIFSQRQKLKSK